MEENNKVYLVVADTYVGSWGAEIEVFMVTESLALSHEKLNRVKDKYRSAEIVEMNMGKSDRTFLGGYYE